MNNEHNPVNQKVDLLRKEWIKALKNNPDGKLIRWLMFVDDIDFLNGLLKVESTTHGKLPEFFIILFSPFNGINKFSLQIAKDWIDMYKVDTKNNSKHNWDYRPFEKAVNSFQENENADLLLKSLLENFSKHYNKQDRNIVVGLIPQHITDLNAYSAWVSQIVLNDLPKQVQLMVLDHQDKEFLDGACQLHSKSTITIRPENMDFAGTLEQIATQGNPNDPQIQIRKCMFEMGKALPKNKRKLNHWGEQLLKAGQRTGELSTFASMHLIYAGFLMHFKEKNKILDLLDKGIQIAKKSIKSDQNSIPVLIQLFGYKGACYSMNGKHKMAVEWFEKQAKAAIEFDLVPIAISAYKSAIYLADVHHLDTYNTLVFDAYKLGESMDDKDIAITEYPFIANHFIKTTGERETIKKLETRLSKIFGSTWKEDLENILHPSKNYSKELQISTT